MKQPEKPYMVVAVIDKLLKIERYATEVETVSRIKELQKHPHWLIKHTVLVDGSNNLDCAEPLPPNIRYMCLLTCTGVKT